MLISLLSSPILSTIFSNPRYMAIGRLRQQMNGVAKYNQFASLSSTPEENLRLCLSFPFAN